jgi:type IV pilus assembly protein PilN
MIRINLLGQPRPKARRAAVPLGGTLQMLSPLIVLLVAVLVLFVLYSTRSSELESVQNDVKRLRDERAQLEQIKQQVEAFERQKAVLQQRISVIEDLRRQKTGGQELLDSVATTVARTEELWLTSIERKGNALTIEGTAGSINAVANYITQLKRSGYFDKVEIKESRQDERSTAVQTFLFSLTAEFVLPETAAAAARAGG